MIGPWFSLFDAAQSEWIVSLDDDDVALCPLPLPGLSDGVGYVHGDVAAVFTETGENAKRAAGDVLLRRTRPIERPGDANLAIGSYWAMRREAWASIARHVERDVAGYNDFRIVWHLMRAGWRTVHVPRYTQIQRANPNKGPARYHQIMQQTGGWPGVVAHLERAFAGVYGAPCE